MEKVLEGSVQDPLEALTEEENRRARLKEEEIVRAEKEKELMQKAYGQCVKKIKELLLTDKQNIRKKKKDENKKEELLLVVDMLANVVESEDKDAIQYAFIAYKYVAKAHKRLFFGKARKLKKLIKEIVNAI